MDILAGILPWLQVTLSILLVAAILLQQSKEGLGSAFGGDSGGGVSYTKRGAEKTLFSATIILAILFAISSVLSLFA
ncbi:MAG: Preprotein translocase, SecG subunit [Candidatus Giovannonibacteria bacterium GW2011_GWA2_53_7]|uniref:Protein-export membrane protein SecG n=1 Tax=Candidatus Giovannonibacteria bacterium GW2011_GWA2_53_7 TaxID=1618650 RepID=A0A0G1XU71_9BACT|nr:MAG: Preprotein translocase, SecG subunit [Candidatus Giovannonibacteria bacterium GW2011_GWA2_53_7]